MAKKKLEFWQNPARFNVGCCFVGYEKKLQVD